MQNSSLSIIHDNRKVFSGLVAIECQRNGVIFHLYFCSISSLAAKSLR